MYFSKILELSVEKEMCHKYLFGEKKITSSKLGPLWIFDLI